jgi:methylmalonyl-CoA mutase, N-terminal domain
LALPSEESARVALRTQQIIASESGVTNTVDPFGGAYYIEKLTNEIEEGVTDLLRRIDALGGTLAAVESGFIQRQIQDSAYKAQLAIDTAEATVVGVNRYTSDETERIEVFTLDPALERAQADRVQALRARRDSTIWKKAIDVVAAAARGTENLVPPIIAAVEAEATVGEIADTLRSVFGEYKEVALD